MKLKSLTLATAICCSPLSLTAQENSITVNPDLTTALKYVDTDGQFLSISDNTDYLDSIANQLDKYILPNLADHKALNKLSFKKILSSLALNDIKGISRSTKKHGEIYINKHFIQTDNTKGLWSFLGARNQSPIAASYAPANTNLLLETKLNTEQLYSTIAPLIAMYESPETAQVEQMLNTQAPGLNMSFKELIAKIDAHLSIVSEIDFNPTIDNIDTPPSYKATARIQNLVKLLWPAIEPNLASLPDLKQEGNQYSMEFPTPESTVFIHIDLDKDLIWASTDKQHLNDCRNPTENTLKNAETYKKATSLLPKNSNSQLYVSQQLLTGIAKITPQILKQIPNLPSNSHDVAKEIISFSEKTQGMAFTIDKNTDGLLITSNTPLRLRGNTYQDLAIISTLSSISTPLILQKRQDADYRKNLSQLNQLHFALIEYKEAHNNSPKTLEDLIKDQPDVRNLLTMRTSDGDALVEYRYIETPKDNDIIMYTLSPRSNQYIVLRHNGAVQGIVPEQFREETK